MSKKYLYLFSEGNATMRELLGGKGANLAEMTHIGLPVPADVCRDGRGRRPVAPPPDPVTGERMG